MYDKAETQIISLIRYFPSVLIILLSIVITYFIEKVYESHFQEESRRTTEFFSDFNKAKVKEEVEKIYDYIETQDINSMKNLKIYLKNRVYEAHAIASNIYRDNKHTKTNKEILVLIKSALGSIIFNNGRGYYFINNNQGIILLQPLNRKIENKNFTDVRDAKGYHITKAITQSIIDKTERYDSYFWSKNENDKTASRKISFYKYFEPLNLSIGTGEYLDDYENELKRNIIRHIQNIKLNNDEYIFLFDYKGYSLAHKDRNNIGKNFLHLKDKNNLEFVKMVIEESKKGPKFHSYFNATMKDQPYEKTSYVRSYDKWKWTLGVGYNEAQLIEMLSAAQGLLVSEKEEIKKVILSISILSTISLLIIAFVLSKFLENILIEYKQKIIQEEKEFNNFFELSVNLNLISDMNGTVILINNMAESTLGYRKDELINSSFLDLVHPSDVDNTIEEMKYLSHGKFVESFENRYKSKSGEYIDLRWSAQADKNTGLIYASAQNITAVKLAEIEKIKLDKILLQQSKMASMGSMIENIAHQWRQPLSAIAAISSGLELKNELRTVDEALIVHATDRINRNVQHLSQTIDDFKNFFKENSNKSEFNFHTTFEKTFKLMESQFKNENITLVKEVIDINILGFENELIQVLINILNNARDELVKKEQEVKLIFIKTSIYNNMIEICIQDNAGGIPFDVISEVFKSHFTTKEDSNGTGVGLTMSKMIIEEHMDGIIQVKNIDFNYQGNSYTGAEFKICLPMNK